MKTASLVGSISRRAGGLFESVRRLHQELLASDERQGDCSVATRPGDKPIKVRVMTARDEFTSLDLHHWEPVPVHVFDRFGPGGFCYVPGLLKQMVRIGPDLVHLHGLWQYFSIATKRWHERCRRPYVVSPHGMLDPWALRNCMWRKWIGWLGYERAVLRDAACIRALCGAEAKAARNLGLAKPICVIPNGVDLPCLQRSGSLGSGWNDTYSETRSDALKGRKVLLFLGRIHLKKGLIPLVRAWARANAAGEWVLVIAGWGQDGHEQELKLLAHELGLSWTGLSSEASARTRLIFIGPQFGANKRFWLERCDAFILPSFSEGLPMAVLEAWAYAKPVLISPQCNLPEGNAAGAAISIQATEGGIVAGLSELFSASKGDLKDCGNRGRTLVEQNFTWQKAARELRKVYCWLSDAGPRPDCLYDGSE